MSTVRITHPDGLESEVPESALPHWRSSGWDLAPERETKPPTPPEGDKDSKPRGSRRRTTDEESE